MHVIDEALSVREGRLWVEDCDVQALGERFGTPLYVVSEQQLRRNARRWREALAASWPEGPTDVLASIKASPLIALRRILSQEGLGCDTFGPGELHAALEGGVPPGRISVNGSIKNRAMIRRALTAGARITIDSPAELDLCEQEAASLGTRARVRVRLKPAFPDLTMPSELVPLPVSAAAHVVKYGIPLDELLPLGLVALAMDYVDLVGVHFHIGRHSADPMMWRAVVDGCIALVAQCRDEWGGWTPREIDLGGGFPAPRDPISRDQGHGNRLQPRAPSIEASVATITEALRAAMRRHGLDPGGVLLEVEPGRGLHGNAGIHLTTVHNLKETVRPHPRRWVEVDTSEVHLSGQYVEGARLGYLVAARAGEAPSQRADIVGITCGFERLSVDARLPRVDVGDVIAYLDTGAYEEAASSNFNALPRPGTALVNGGDAELIRRHETIGEVFARDLVPVRLR
jgi:diaminopimelate decarboxylase